MSRLFDDASSEYLYYSSAIVASPPFTYAAWFRTNDVDITQEVISQSVDGAGYNGYWLSFRGAEDGDYLQARLYAVSLPVVYAATTTSVQVNTWHHGCAVFAATDSRSVYLDGGGKGTDTTSKEPVVDNFTIGADYYNNGNPEAFFSGNIAHVSVWNVALTDAEVAALADGADPRTIRPDGLVFYAPLVRDEDYDIVGGVSLTPVNTPTIADQPPKVFGSARAHYGIGTAAAPAAGLARLVDGGLIRGGKLIGGTKI